MITNDEPTDAQYGTIYNQYSIRYHGGSPEGWDRGRKRAEEGWSERRA